LVFCQTNFNLDFRQDASQGKINFNAKAQRRGDAKHSTRNLNGNFSFASLRPGVFALNPFPFRHFILTWSSLRLVRVWLNWQHGEPDFARG
jgi:hypothetical protein